ncbi:MAG: hypothetical protein FWH38_01150 [Treponema sp.]|nr:hypothetical protein [Treponema sp.]
MAKKTNTIYEPGELDRVRGKLGDIDETEAKRMAQILGGEVGVEKSVPVKAQKGTGRIRRETVELMVPGKQKKRPSRPLDIIGDDDNSAAGKPVIEEPLGNDPADDPAVQLRTTYFERVKMDRYAAQFEYEIKNSMQVLISTLSLFGEPVDYVNPRFVNNRMNFYYSKLQTLVASTLALLPVNNAKRSERLKKTSPLAYTILDAIRSWNIDRIDKDLSRIQAHPRAARVSEFADILRAVYKPLFVMEKLDLDIHIKGAYKLLYKILYIENPMEPKEKNQDLVRNALTAFAEIRREVHCGLYPLLMKFISDRWFPYERLFIDRRRRFMSFIGVTQDDQLKPASLLPERVESAGAESPQDDGKNEQEAGAEEEGESEEKAEDQDDPKAAEQRAKEMVAEAEKKALDHSLSVLESLFPQAGWADLAEYPDLYPYFVNTYGLRRGYELIAPSDPLQQVAILMHIVEDLCVALRYVSFGTVIGPDGNPVRINETAGDTITNWRRYIDDSFSKEYLPRLTEYCRILEHSTETRTSPYAKRTMNELRWTKRLYFLPYYKFESFGPPPFQKQNVTAIYSEIRSLRRNLTMVAAGIEKGNRAGGADAKVHCEGIENPWDQYNFEVPNPVSRRMDVLLGHSRRNNAALIFFSLSAATVLDYLVNSEDSWAYTDRPGAIFRSINGEGVVPMFGVDNKLDADQIFKDVMKKKEEARHKTQGHG